MLELAHDVFFGDLQFSQVLDGITLSHRIANSAPQDVRTHTHRDAHLVLVTSGVYVSTARNDVSRGVAVIYNPPETTHRDHFRHGRGSFFTVSILTARLAQLADTRLQPMATYLMDSRARGLTVTLLMECARWDSSSPLVAESLCLELMSAASERFVSPIKMPPPWLRTARELIQDCASEHRSVSEIAKSVGVHPTHFARAFRTFLGCTPGDLLRARRLEMAASMLLNGDCPISDVAFASGFSDQAQLTKSFCRAYGMPPGAFRRLRPDLSKKRNVAF